MEINMKKSKIAFDLVAFFFILFGLTFGVVGLLAQNSALVWTGIGGFALSWIWFSKT